MASKTKTAKAASAPNLLSIEKEAANMATTPDTRKSSEDFIGLDQVYYAPVSEDKEGGYVVGTPKFFAPTAQLTKTTAGEIKNTYYDNGVYRALSGEDADELKIVTPALDLVTLADISGKHIDPASGALLDSGDPETKYFAILARALLSDYSYRYYVWHKVTFKVPDEEIVTKGESVDPKGQELTASAVKTQFKYDIGGKKKGIKRIIVDERDGKVDVSKWNDAVPVPGNIPLIVPA